ncbi:hypothetical protein ACLKA6_014063 [Drosophila palustris]
MRLTLGLICVLCSYLPGLIRAAEIDLGSEKTALKSNLFGIFDVSRQQQELLNNLIESTFAEIEKSAKDCAKVDGQSTTEKSAQTGIDKNTCGYRKEATSTGTFSDGAEREAAISEFPWMIAVLEGEEFIAGGVLIARDKVLTSASKLDGKNPGQISVRAAEWDKQSNNEVYPPQNRMVREIIQHDDFKNNKKYNDIAVLQLKLNFSDVPYIKPICLADSLDDIDQTNCLVTAWGSQNSILQYFPVSPMAASECENSIRRQNISWFGEFVRENVLCTAVKPDMEACGAGSGSPLVCSLKKSGQQYSLVGLVNCGWKPAHLASTTNAGYLCQCHTFCTLDKR